MIKIKPLICNARVAKCFVAGEKTETRRLPRDEMNAPRYRVGDLLWIREPAKVIYCNNIFLEYDFEYISDGKRVLRSKIPDRFMKEDLSDISAKWLKDLKGVPNGCVREMARLFYRVTEARLQRLKDITIDEIIKEGFVPAYRTQGEDRDSGYEWWIDTWNETAPTGKQWEDNPIVEVFCLEKIEQPSIYN